MTGISGGVRGVDRLPGFELPAAGGETVRSWDYRGRRHLVVWLAGPRPAWGALREAAAREHALRSEGAELLVVLRMPAEQAEEIQVELGLRVPILIDADGRVHTLVGAEEPTLLVTDRNAMIYWRAPAADGRPDFGEALTWLEYLNILEPECGTCVPAWPPELFAADPSSTPGGD